MKVAITCRPSHAKFDQTVSDRIDALLNQLRREFSLDVLKWTTRDVRESDLQKATRLASEKAAKEKAKDEAAKKGNQTDGQDEARA